MIKLAIRGYANARIVFEDRIEVSESDLDKVIPQYAERHARALAKFELHMIEIEFVDDPGPDRFFRFGTDPSGMVMPFKFDL